MSGALMQIVAYGAQDVEIIDSNAASFFHKKHAKHAPFAIQPVELSLPHIDAVFGNAMRVTVPRNGDLVSKIWLEMTMTKSGPTYLPGEELLREVKIVMGGQIIDTHTSNFIRCRNEVFMTRAEKEAYRRLVDFVDGEAIGATKTMYMPLSFWFCEYARALPLIAIQRHDVELHFTFAKTVAGITATPKLRLFVEYVYLGDEERRYLVTRDHFIPIPQVFQQEDRCILSTTGPTTLKTQIFARNPCSYMMWTYGPRSGDFANYSCDFKGGTNDALDPMLDATLILSGHERFPVMPSFFYNSVQPYAYNKTAPAAGIHFVSFSLDPGSTSAHSGSCNFSRIGAVVLNQTFKRVDLNAMTMQDLTTNSDIIVSASNFENVNIYVVSWNFLRITGGLAGTAYPL